MAKKKASGNKQLKISQTYIALAVVGIVSASLLTITRLTLSPSHVLGVNTLLAKGGDDSGGEDSGGGSGGGSSNSGSGSSDSSGGSSSGSGSGSSSNSSETKDTSTSQNSNASQNVSAGTQVNCTGPDGKTFQTTALNCEDINKQWNHRVSFTVIDSPKKTLIPVPTKVKIKDDKNIEQKNEVETKSENDQEPVEVKSKDQKIKVNLKKHGTVIELKSGQESIELQAKQVDGKEIELGDDSLAAVNQELENENKPEIEKDSSGDLVLKHGTIKAKTSLPISVNLSTNELTVTTEKGSTVLTVLPDDAVNKLISQKIIDSVKPGTENTINLTEVDNKPVFEVEGIDNQKLLGLFSVEIRKKVFVSAEDGSVESTTVSLGQKLLDLLSF